MNNKIVIGLGFGDEGKGRVVDWLSSTANPDLVVRFSGGHQAAHNVMIDEQTSHIFSSFGSGTLRNIPTYYSYFCTVDPVGVLNEYDVLRSKGIEPLLMIDAKCPIVTPLDKKFNLIRDNRKKHGTCGVGFGTTLQREEQRYSLLYEDLFNPTVFKIKLDMIENYYNSTCHNLWDKSGFIKDCKYFINMGFPVIDENRRKSILHKNCIFEGSQGLLLDQDIGFFPHVTRSNTDLTNAIKLKDSILGFNNAELYLVTRAYQTRHGNGPMTNKTNPVPDNPYEINEDTGPQGNFRKSMLDVDLLKYGIEKSGIFNQIKGNINLVITCMDVIESYSFTKNEKCCIFGIKSEFVNAIAKELEIDNVYVSDSPYGNIKKVL